MAAAKAPLSSSAGRAGSLDDHSTCLRELRSQIAAQSGRLVLVSESEKGNGYSVYYQPAASSASICKKYYGEVLQRWQLRHKREDKPGSFRKHVEAAARRASLRQAERERLRKQMQLVEKAHGKRQELLESKCAQAQQSLEARTMEAWNRRTEQQEGLKMKLLEHFKKSARCREELERRAAELRNKIEAREKQAHALRTQHLQKIRRKCAATAERTSLASTVTSTDERSTPRIAALRPLTNHCSFDHC